MKILKIEINNIGVLQGQYTVDFTREPLKSAGLFAITGPAGTGKSTLLEAASLALYGHSPRWSSLIEARGEAEAADAILSHGSKEGGCKVSFAVAGGIAYRVEWGAKRTAPSAPATVSRQLYQLKPRQEAWKTPDTLQQHVIEVTGLSYSQFITTIYLAQESFSQFLTDDKDDKARLLERLTGTHLYSLMSQETSRRTMQARSEYEAIVHRMEGISKGRLDDADLQRSQEESNLLRGQLSRSQDELRTDRQLLAWYDKYHQAQARLDKLKAVQYEAQRTYNTLYNKKQLLERYDKVSQFKTLYDAIASRKQAIEDIKAAVTDKKQQLRQLADKLKQIQHDYDVASERYDEVLADYQSRMPLFAKAHTMLGHIKADEEALASQHEAQTQLQEKLKTLTDQANARHQQLDNCQKKLSDLKLALQAISMHRPLIEHFSEIRAKLIKMDDLRQDAQLCEKKIEAIRKEIRTNETKTEQLKKEKDELASQKSSLQDELHIHLQANQGLNSQDIQARIIKLSEEERDALNARDLWGHIADNYADISETSDKIRALEAKIEQLDAELPKQEKLLDAANKQRDIAEGAFQASQSANIKSLRNHLKEGSPCSVCGATHHPYHTETEQAVGELMENLEQNFIEAKKLVVTLRTGYENLIRQRADLQARYDTTKDYLAKAKKHLEANIAQWARYKSLDQSFADTSSSVSRENRMMLISQLLDNAGNDLKKERKAGDEFNRHQQAINDINAKIRQVNDAIAQSNNNISELKAQRNVHDSMTAELEERRTTDNRDTSTMFEEISPLMTLPLWHNKWNNEFDSLIQQMDKLYEDWTSANTQLNQESFRATMLKSQCSTLDDQLQEAQQASLTRQSAISSLTDKITTDRNNILKMFNGQQLDEVITSINRNTTQAAATKDTCKVAFDRITRDFHLLTGEIDNLTTMQQSNEEKLRQENSQLDIQISRFNNDNSPLQYFELQKLFEDTRDWNALRSELISKRQALERANYDVEGAMQDIQSLQQAEVHASEDPSESELAVKDRVDYLQAEVQRTQERLEAITLATKKHERCVAELQELEPDKERLAHTLADWQALDETIGSADGSKFRNIAQRYILRAVVDAANAELKKLNPRYSLQVASQSLDVELIDHNILDQLHSASDLSSAERYLVSLALALGLAAMQSGNLASDRIFIDSSFGDLDTAGLNVIIGCLGRLQALYGYKIGVVSHNAQIAERIVPQLRLSKSVSGTVTLQGN